MKIKVDTYLSNRGGFSKIISLSCAKCDKKLGKYQKDDPSPLTGTLKRLYVDRCNAQLRRNLPDYRSGRRWDCPGCSYYLGFAAPYKKENNRPAWYLLIETINYTE